MKEQLTLWLGSVHLDDFARACRRRARRARRHLLGIDRKIIADYLGEQAVRKLQIGSGQHLLEGWLNSSYDSGDDGVLHVDATRRYPFANDVFDFVYSEHMIEHVSHAHGGRMLSECHRVLKPGGTVRIVTPDLRFLWELYAREKTDLQRAYIEECTKLFVKDAPRFADIFVINNFFRAWGHQFIYDATTLEESLVHAGFTNVVRCALNESAHPDLRGIAHDKRYAPGFLALESLTIEGSKAA